MPNAQKELVHAKVRVHLCAQVHGTFIDHIGRAAKRGAGIALGPSESKPAIILHRLFLDHAILNSLSGPAQGNGQGKSAGQMLPKI